MCDSCGCSNHQDFHIILPVNGMACDHCSAQINQVLNALPGVTAHADYVKGEVSLVLSENADLPHIKQTLENLGFEVL
ncbi:MAG: heavy metal-associated domain-containing protein [Clostridiales bacterium]